MELKLSNIANNISIYEKITNKKYKVIIRNGVIKNIKEILTTIIKEIQDDPTLLNYFNYDENEVLIIEDVILNGLEYPGVFDDFIDELRRKNNLNIWEESIETRLMYKFMDAKKTNLCIKNAINKSKQTGKPIEFLKDTENQWDMKFVFGHWKIYLNKNFIVGYSDKNDAVKTLDGLKKSKDLLNDILEVKTMIGYNKYL